MCAFHFYSHSDICSEEENNGLGVGFITSFKILHLAGMITRTPETLGSFHSGKLLTRLFLSFFARSVHIKVNLIPSIIVFYSHI